MEDQIINKSVLATEGDILLQITVRRTPLKTSEEARQAKRGLEEAINNLVWNYEQRTGCIVASLDKREVPLGSGKVKTFWVPKVLLGVTQEIAGAAKELFRR